MSFALTSKDSSSSTSSFSSGATAGGFGYAVHPKTSLASITARGLLSAHARTGQIVADPEGSFAKNRRKMETAKQVQKLAWFLATIYASGNDLAGVENMTDAGRMLIYSSAGEIARDTEPANKIWEEQEKEAFVKRDDKGYFEAATQYSFEQYCERHGFKLFGAQSPDKPKDYTQKLGVRTKPAFIGLVKTIFDNGQHYLTRLAINSVSLSYDLEAAQTAAKIYFSLISSAASQVESYAKQHGGMSEIFVLRVAVANLNPWEGDPSDGNAIRTPGPVPVKVIDVYKLTAPPTREALATDANWGPLVVG
jgi:hypothetical protein